jgi:serine/threonine-protein kinase
MTDPIILNNRYQLDERLGTGGMAVVYRARDLMLERPVAIKILRENFSKDPEFRERFRQEARAAANLSHPNIVTVHDFGLDSGRLFIVMENVPGTDLKSLLRQRRFGVSGALALAVQACAGVGYAHRAGLVHCDIKPHNMLITPDKRLKVTDFGIARALATIQPEERIEIIWGSPQYFAPEQATGGPPSPASDVYSLGVVLYEMLTGRLPFVADNAVELARLHREVPPPSPREFNPEIPRSLEQILLKVLSKEPSSRYRTADQFGRVLVSFTGAEETAFPPQQAGENEAAAWHGGGAAAASPAARRTSAARTPPYSPPAPEPPPPETIIYPRAQVFSQPQPRLSPPPAVRRTAEEGNPLDFDWGTILLWLLAIIAVGGLIPLYLWVYFLYLQ